METTTEPSWLQLIEECPAWCDRAHHAEETGRTRSHLGAESTVGDVALALEQRVGQAPEPIGLWVRCEGYSLLNARQVEELAGKLTAYAAQLRELDR